MKAGDISRRDILRGAGAGSVIGLAGCSGGGGGDDEDGGSGDDTDGGTTEPDSFDGIRIGVMQDITGPNGPGLAHMGVAGLLSGFGYKNNRETPKPLSDEEPARPEPAGVMEGLVGETLRYTVEDIDSVGSVEFELLIRDTKSDAQTAGEVTSTLISDHDVDILYGLSSSDGLERINNTILGQIDVPLFVGQGLTSAVTSDANSCRDQLFRATGNNAMTSRAGAISLAQDFDIEKVAMFGVDTSLGKDVLRNYNRIFDQEDTEVVKEEFVSVGQTNWETQLTEAEDLGAEAVIYGFSGQTGTFFAEEFVRGGYEMEAFGQAPERMTFRQIGENVREFLQQEFEVNEITPQIVEALPFGPVSCRYFWNQYDNDINDWLVENHIDTYGVVPGLFTGSAFTTASTFIQAFEQAGEASSEAILQEVPGMAVRETPKGKEEYVFQEYNNQARSPVTIGEYQLTKEEYWPAALQPSERTQFVDKDLTTIPEDDPDMSCNLRLS